jgi:2-polyprenyl-3-methyl-5-hydroxy-6-metoxy-1,4-benzoquinol methylase
MLALLDATGPADIDLPVASEKQIPDEPSEAILRDIETELGVAATSDYFKCSRDRFLHLIGLARRHWPAGGRIIDVGNAPGYLGLALHRAGFRISGINLSDSWNATYASHTHLEIMDVCSCDIENSRLPFDDASADGILFTEVLEHIAITHPSKILAEFRRVLRPGSSVIFSTPNVCNLSNIIALAKGLNVFWSPEQFYGSTDRHNREWTPAEVRKLFNDAGFIAKEFYGVSDHANWRVGAAEDTYALLAQAPSAGPLLRNTIVAAFAKYTVTHQTNE